MKTTEPPTIHSDWDDCVTALLSHKALPSCFSPKDRSPETLAAVARKLMEKHGIVELRVANDTRLAWQNSADEWVCLAQAYHGHPDVAMVLAFGRAMLRMQTTEVPS
jgi:hypothetical protein